MSAFAPIQPVQRAAAMDVDVEDTDPTRAADIPQTAAARHQQMINESLTPQYRRERLKRLIYNSQQPYSSPDPNYVNNIQGGVMQKTWRRKVVEWLLEFVDEFGLPNDIVAVAVNYMDVYLSKRKVNKINLQLLAMVCVFVASKFHEVEPISIQELQTLAEGGYTEDSIRNLELDLLNTLDWNMNPITTHHIMRHVANYLSPDIRWNLLEHAEGFCDYALTDYEFIRCSKINVAVAAVLCGLQNIGRSQFDEGWLVSELQNYVFVGVTQADQAEIQLVRQKLSAVFYKNFPHLAPKVTSTTLAVDTRALSPTGVDAFPSSRSSSPVCNVPGSTGSPTSKFGPTTVVGNVHYPTKVTKVTMVVGPTKGTFQNNGFMMNNGFASSSSSAFGLSR